MRPGKDRCWTLSAGQQWAGWLRCLGLMHVMPAGNCCKGKPLRVQQQVRSWQLTVRHSGASAASCCWSKRLSSTMFSGWFVGKKVRGRSHPVPVHTSTSYFQVDPYCCSISQAGAAAHSGVECFLPLQVLRAATPSSLLRTRRCAHGLRKSHGGCRPWCSCGCGAGCLAQLCPRNIRATGAHAPLPATSCLMFCRRRPALCTACPFPC